MMQWRVSKYDPRYRDQYGRYTRNEWTSVSDIGKDFEDGQLTQADYLVAESRYLLFVEALMNSLDVPHMMVRQPGRYRSMGPIDTALPKILKNKLVLEPEAVVEAIRDSLRERSWCRLIYKRRLRLQVGWDFYLHFACEGLNHAELDVIAGRGLDVQPWVWIDPIRE